MLLIGYWAFMTFVPVPGHGTAEAYYGIGRIRTANGDLTAAVESYRKACELFPAYGAAHYGLAPAYPKLGESLKSEEHLKLHAAGKTLVPPVPDPPRDEMRAINREEALKYGRQAREQAAARGQTELLRSIDKHLGTLEASAPR